MNQLFSNIAQLGIKMRVFRAIQIADTDAGVLKDREILILELLKTQGSMNMTELSRFFPGVKLSTLSTDIKKLRSELDLIDMKVDKHDMRIHIIELSEKGFAKVEEILAKRARSYIPLSKAIGNDPDELEILNRIVERAITLVDGEINKFADTENQ